MGRNEYSFSGKKVQYLYISSIDRSGLINSAKLRRLDKMLE